MKYKVDTAELSHIAGELTEYSGDQFIVRAVGPEAMGDEAVDAAYQEAAGWVVRHANRMAEAAGTLATLLDQAAAGYDSAEQAATTSMTPAGQGKQADPSTSGAKDQSGGAAPTHQTSRAVGPLPWVSPAPGATLQS